MSRAPLRAAVCLAIAAVLAAPTLAAAQDSAKVAPPEVTRPAQDSTVAPGKVAPAPVKLTPAPAQTAKETPAPASTQAEPESREPPPAPALRAVPAGSRAAKATGMCGVCHSDIHVQYDKGIHRSEGIGCVSCHGGDPNATTIEAAHRGNGYRGKIRRRDVPRLCASCHSDVARMRPYNLPSNQYELYQTSHHGMQLAKGDETVAVCTDCHGKHEIRRRDDPMSSVSRRNIPATCGRCHSLTAVMRRHNHKGDPFSDYKAGVHGKALLLDGNDASPECASCHGSHGATPPGFGDVDKVCGQCHAKTRTYFLASAHSGEIEQNGLSECAACHGNHKTGKTSVEMFTTICADCHDKGSEEAHVAGRMKSMLVEASAEIDHARGLVAKAAAIPLYVEDYQSRLEDARTALLETVPVTHTLDTTLVEPHARRARSIAIEVSKEIDEKLAARWWRYVGLGIFWFYLLLTATILTRARRRAAGERGG